MSRLRSWRFVVPLLAALLGTSLVAFRSAPPAPALVVIVVVDQMRGDYIRRWERQWTGAFARFRREGAVFPNGMQDHAITSTAPGHSTVLSGREPVHTGIVMNSLGAGDTASPLLGTAQGPGASPHRFRGTTLIDWMRAQDSALGVLAVGGKDRSVILNVGRSKVPVFWFSGGDFTTSRYYADSLPAWLTAWNARGGARRMAGRAWMPLLPDTEYSEVDDAPGEAEPETRRFPHLLPVDSAEAARRTYGTPWLDSLTMDVALEGARAMRLGRRRRPDVLVLSLSATDAVGHRYGPDSREIHDQMLRVDRWLGWLLDSLQTQVSPRGVLVVLTADHGVTRIPEIALARGEPGGRLSLDPLVREANRVIGRRTGDSLLLETEDGLIYGDRDRMRRLGVNPESLATALAPRVWNIPGISDAWTPATLAGFARENVNARRWLRQLPDSFPWLVAAAAKPGFVWGGAPGSATHGTSNPDDVSVPLAFLGPGIRPGLYRDTVRTVDLAPTLARLLDVPVQGRPDGQVIKRVLP